MRWSCVDGKADAVKHVVIWIFSPDEQSVRFQHTVML